MNYHVKVTFETEVDLDFRGHPVTIGRYYDMFDLYLALNLFSHYCMVISE